MADKKKNTNQSSTRRQSQSQLVAPATRNGNRARKSTNQSRVAASTARSYTKAKENTEQNELVAPVSSGEEKEQSKVVKTAARERDERKDQQSKATGRRDNKSQSKALPAWQIRLLNNRYARFVRDAYYELRHKVTWPSFNEARNMTIVVILLSGAVGAVLWIADQGLFQLFLLVGGR